MTKPLKIGFIVNDFDSVPAWYYQTIKEVEQKGYAIFFLVLGSANEKLYNTAILFRLFEWFEDKWFQSEYDVMKPMSIEHLVSNNNSFHSESGFSLSPSKLGQLKSLQLDVLYTIDSNIAGATLISEAATYGLWSIRFGYERYGANNLPAFWEVMDNSPVTGSYLLIQKNGKTMVAYEGTTRTVPHSVKNNFKSVAWKSSSYLSFRLSSLERKRDAFLSECAATHLPASPENARLGNIKMLLLFLKNGVGYLNYKLRDRVNKNKFTILYSFAKFNLDAFDTIKFIPVHLPSKDVFYADPFVVEKDGVNYVFIEEMVYSQGKAHISVITIDQNKKQSPPKVILDKSYHLSYPFVFEYEGIYYMIPETSSNRTVELYKAVHFPDQWEFVINLMEDVVIMDVTLHFEKDKWWLFGNSYNHPFVSTNDQLFLFYSEHLFSSSWIAHPQNPIATHAENCRPAGRIFQTNSKLYRPAQNNASQQYGYGLKINEIEMLNETTYKEKEVYSINPETLGLKACHQIDFSSSIILIDGILK